MSGTEDLSARPMLREIVAREAANAQIDPAVLFALIEVESGGNYLAVRFEPNYKWLVRPEFYAKENDLTLATETCLQRMSFGLMQVMGANCRGYGFSGNLLEVANSPVLGLKFAVTHLAHRYEVAGMASAKGRRGWSDPVIAAYNAGTARRKENGEFINEEYVRKVRAAYTRYAATI